jgi:hypothetical protein
VQESKCLEVYISKGEHNISFFLSNVFTSYAHVLLNCVSEGRNRPRILWFSYWCNFMIKRWHNSWQATSQPEGTCAQPYKSYLVTTDWLTDWLTDQPRNSLPNIPSKSETLCNNKYYASFSLHDKGLLAPWQTSKLKDHTFSAVHDSYSVHL